MSSIEFYFDFMSPFAYLAGVNSVGTPLNSLYLDVRYNGVLEATNHGVATMLIDAGRFYGYRYHQHIGTETEGRLSWLEVDDVFTINLCAWGCPQFGVPFEISLKETVSVDPQDGSAFADFSNSFDVNSRWDDPAQQLRITSAGGFDNRAAPPIPVPPMIWLLASTLGGLMWLRCRACPDRTRLRP